MPNPQTNPQPQTFTGSMRAGSFTAQLGVKLTVTPSELSLRAMGRSFQLDRAHFEGLEETSLLGIFKRGIRFRHSQPSLPAAIIFYPSISRDHFRQQLQELGWS